MTEEIKQQVSDVPEIPELPKLPKLPELAKLSEIEKVEKTEEKVIEKLVARPIKAKEPEKVEEGVSEKVEVEVEEKTLESPAPLRVFAPNVKQKPLENLGRVQINTDRWGPYRINK